VTRDLRKYARRTNLRLILGFVLILLLVGEGLIYWIYGQGAALLGLVCLLGTLFPIGGILLFFWVLERIQAQRQ
jgi:hypothetical protein